MPSQAEPDAGDAECVDERAQAAAGRGRGHVRQGDAQGDGDEHSHDRDAREDEAPVHDRAEVAPERNPGDGCDGGARVDEHDGAPEVAGLGEARSDGDRHGPERAERRAQEQAGDEQQHEPGSYGDDRARERRRPREDHEQGSAVESGDENADRWGREESDERGHRHRLAGLPLRDPERGGH